MASSPKGVTDGTPKLPLPEVVDGRGDSFFFRYREKTNVELGGLWLFAVFAMGGHGL